MCTVIPLSLSEIAAVTNGRLHGARGTEVVTAVEFDSRAIRPGGLFLALPGERVDGHDFAAAAVERGAVGRARRARGRRARGGRAPGRPRARAPTSARPTPTARAPLCSPRSRAWPRTWCGELSGLTVVGVTGSSGKTSTKDLLAAVLAPLGPDGRPARVVQQRARPALDGPARRRRHPPPRAGVLRPRARATSPRWPPRCRRGSAWCSTSARAHLGEFGSVEAIARAKGELVEALPSNGVAVLNADDPRVAAMAAAHRRPRASRSACAADVRAEDLTLDAGPRPVPPRHARGERAGGAAAGRRPPRRQRAGRGRGGGRAGRRPGGGGGGALGRRARVPVADGGDRPRRRRHGGQRRLQRQPRLDAPPRCAPSPRWAAAGAPGPCSGRCASWAPRARPPTQGVALLAEGAGRRRARHGRRPGVRGGSPGRRRRRRPPRCCAPSWRRATSCS